MLIFDILIVGPTAMAKVPLVSRGRGSPFGRGSRRGQSTFMKVV
jgi:hypothetical protein